jgi:hypothetical protein
VRVLPRLALEPPPAYVAFVATHLEPLRHNAIEALGDEDGDRLYPDVLIDVALHWRWLRLARFIPRRPDATGWYLHRALARRTARARLPDREPAQRLRWIRTAAEDEFEDGPQIEFVVWRPYRPHRVFSSGASRLAPYLKPAPRTEFSVLAEAAVAWWHAYQIHRRHRIIALCVALFLLTVFLAQLASAGH